jgi:hypothetical protein
MVIEYTRHAMRRMKWRKISEADVESAVKDPDRVEVGERNRINAYKAIGKKLLKITIFHENDVIRVITGVWKGE